MSTQLSRRERSQSHEAKESQRREMVCTLLTQIFTLAERTRAAKSTTRIARRQSSRSDVVDEADDHAPISLIELIQSSYTVFERYGIGPPDDVVYHRYLLSLSIDPERDWHKKILDFDLGHQPRVKQLCMSRGHRNSPHAGNDRAPNSSFASPVRRQRITKLGSIRPASLLAKSSLISTPRKNSSDQQLLNQRDRFGDMLSLDSPTEPIMRVRVPVNASRRPTSIVPKASAFDTKEVRIVSSHGMVPVPETSYSDEDDDQQPNLEDASISSVASKAADRSEHLSGNNDEPQLQMITTSIEQWQATQAVKQLIKQNKLHDLKSQRQQLTMPLCIHAVFHWVTLSLPERIDFRATESPRTLPLCVLRRLSVNVNVLKQSAHRVWIWRMKTLLRTWHHDAHRVKTFRVRMIVKQRADALETAFRCIQRWRFFTETTKCSGDRARWITQRNDRSRLRDSLKHWRQMFQSKQQQKESSQVYNSRVIRKVFVSWKTNVNFKREERCRYELARKRRMMSQWRQMKDRKQTSRALFAISSDQRRLRLLSESWRRLRLHTLKSQEAQTKANLWEGACRQRRQQQFFCLWKMVIDSKREIEQREARFRRYYRRRRLGQVLATWSSWTEQQVTLMGILSHASRARATRKTALCFEWWKIHFEEATNTEAGLVAQVAQLRRRNIWNRWRKHTGTSIAIRRLDSAYSSHLLCNVFSEWSSYAAKQSDLRFTFYECTQLHERCVMKFHWKGLVTNLQLQQHKWTTADQFKHRRLLSFKQSFVGAWQAHVSKRREYRIRGDLLRCTVRRNGLMRSTWTSWRRAHWLCTVATLATNQLYSYRASRMFRVWKQFVLRSKKRHMRALKIVEMLGCFHVNSCFRQWKQLTAARHHLAIKTEVIKKQRCNGVVKARWTVWRLALKAKRGQHERLSVVASRWQNRQLYASFHSWKTTWTIRKRHRGLLQATRMTSKHRVVEIHFNGWKKRWLAVSTIEHRIHEAQMRLFQFKLKRAIRCWNILRLAQHERSRLLVKSIALWRQTYLATAFRHWLAYKQKRKLKKSQASVARSHHRKRLVRCCLTAWSKLLQSIMLTSFKFKAVSDRLTRLKQLRSIQSLNRNTHSKQRLRAAHMCVVAVRTNRAKILGYSRWKDYIAQKHCKQQDSTDRADFLQEFRVRKGIQRWRGFVHVQKLTQRRLVSAITASTSSLLQLHFRNWKKFVTRKVFFRALKQKAVAFRCFCLLPMCFEAWTTFMVKCKLKRELIRRARGLWCHQRESSAFRTWVQYTTTSRQTKRAIEKWRNQSAIKSFTSWKRFVFQQKKKRRDWDRAFNFHDQHVRQYTLQEWCLTARHARLSRKCAQMWHQNTSRQAFDSWLHHVKLFESGRALIAKMRSRTLVRIFTAWKEYMLNKSSQLQGIQERFALLWQMDKCIDCFSRWKKYARFRGIIRRKLGGQLERLLQDIVRQWRRIAVSRSRSRKCSLQVTDRAGYYLMQSSWGHWRAKARTIRSVKALQEKATKTRLTGDLRERICRWKKFTVRSLAVKDLKHRRNLELVRLVFIQGLQIFVQLKRKEQTLVKKISCVHNTFLKGWLATKVQERMKVIEACENIQRSGSSTRLLTAAWGEWMNFYAKKQNQQVAVRQLRIQLARLEERGSLLDSGRLANMLRRWQTIHVAQIFEHWLGITQAQRQTRHHTVMAINWWHKAQCKRFFCGWLRFCQQQKMQGRIRAMHAKSKLKRTWKVWQAFRAVALSKKVMNMSARAFNYKNVQQQAFTSWRATANVRRSLQQQILELYHSSRLRLLAALVGEWRKFAAMEKTKRTLLTIARVVFEDVLAKRCFTKWKTSVAGICNFRRQLQINTERLQVLLLCSSIRAWRSWSQQHKKLRTIMQTLSCKSDSLIVSRLFLSWHLHVEKNGRLRHQASSFLRFRRLHKGIVALQKLTQEQKQLRTISQKAHLFRSALVGNHVTTIFIRWRKFSSLSRKMRAVTLRYLQNKLLPAAWNAWVNHVHEKCDRKNKCLAAALCWKNAFLRKSWNAMVLVHKVKTERYQVKMCAELHHRQFRLRKTVSEWHQSSKESRHFRAVCGKLVARWRMQTAYRCFCALHDHAVYRKTTRTKQAAVKVKAQTSSTLQAWYAWRKLLLILRSGKRRLLQRYWTLWIRSRESRKALQSFHEQFHAKFLRSTQLRCMANLKQFVASSKIEKAMLVMSTAFADTQLVKRTWTCWRKHVARVRTMKLRMRDALGHMKLQLQFKTFRSLLAYTLKCKRKTNCNHRAQAFQSHQLQTRWFSKWRAVVVNLITRRQMLAQYLNVMQHSLQRKSFRVWSDFVDRRKLLRVKVSESLALRTQMCSHMVFQTWKSFVIKTRKDRKAYDFCVTKTLMHVVKHWKQYVVLCKVEHMMGTSTTRLMETSFLNWRKTVMATHQIRAFQAKSARKHWLGLVGMIFRAWQQRSLTHAQCRKLLASVAVRNHLRFRLMLWQKFIAHRKRLGKLLLIVADPPAPLALITFENESGGTTTVTGGEFDNVEGDRALLTDLEGSSELQVCEKHRDLVFVGQALAKKARILQRFDVTWDLPQAWHRWRQIFHAQLFYRMRRQQQHFICWQQFAHQQRRSRWIVVKLTNQRRAASAQTVFRVWAELVGRVKQLQRDRMRERELWVLVTTEMARRERRQLKTVWHAWKFHVEEARHLQSSLEAYYRARLMTKFWLVWSHDFRQIVRDEQRRTNDINSHMRSFHLRRALRMLRAHQQRMKRARLVLEYFGNRRYDTVLPEVLSRWRSWCQRQREIAHCLAIAKTQRTHHHFATWKRWKNTRKWQRKMVNSLQSRSVEQCRRDVWMRWKHYVKNRVVKDLALQKATIFHVCIRLQKRWLRYTQRAIQLREHAETANLELCAFRGHQAVNRWRDFSRARRLRRLYNHFVLRKHVQLWQMAAKHAVATRFEEFLLRSKAKKMLVVWQQVATKHSNWRQLCASFVSKQEAQAVRHVFVRWQTFVNARQAKRLATMHVEHTTQQRVWQLWSRLLHTGKLRRQEQLERAVEHEERTLLRQCMKMWQTAVKKQRERRFVVLTCVVKLESLANKRVQEVVFGAWKQFTQCERHLRVVLFKRECNIAKRALLSWTAWAHSQQKMRKKLDSAASYHDQRLVSSVFFYWQTYALAWQDAAKPTARKHVREMMIPVKSALESCSREIFEDSEDSDGDVRRPTSPVMKRLRQNKVNCTRRAEDSTEIVVTLPDAVEISMDVKKRLMLLGKWKCSQKSKSLL